MLSILLAMVDEPHEKRKFQIIYEKYVRLLFHVAKEILHDDFLAEDAVQEAFVRIANNIKKISEPECPETRNYAVIIVRNVSFDLLKKEKKRHLRTAPEDDAEEAALLEMDGSVEELTELIRALPATSRDILYLQAKGYSPKEMGKMFSISEEGARKRLSRARAQLKKMLEEGEQNG